jgi:hypothetical protein
MKLYTKRLLPVLILAIVFGVLGCLLLTAIAQVPSARTPADDAYQRIFDDQIARTKRYEGLLTRQEEMMKKQEDLMKRQEEGANRFLTICEKWEKQQQQFQRYLDSLGRK